MNDKAIEPVQRQAIQQSKLMRPVANPVDLIAAHKEAASVIRDALQDGVDYGVIPGTGTKKVLLKPGSERLMVAFGLRPVFTIIEKEIDHDRVNKYIDRYKKEATSFGLYRYTIKCELFIGDEIKGEGIGAASTLETKFISRPRDAEGNILKIAKKRAQVDAVLSVLSLSDRFTQDVDDSDEIEEAPVQKREAPRSEPKVDVDAVQSAELRAKIGQALTELGYIEDHARVNKVKLEAGLGGAPPKTVEQLRATLAKLEAEVKGEDDKPIEGEVIE